MKPQLLRIGIQVALSLFGAGRMTAAETMDYEYDGAGRLVGLRYSNGLHIDYHHDPGGNLVVRRYQTFVDSDRDGMEDTWEMNFFKTLVRDGKGDFDGDGSSDQAEFMAGTNPTSSASVLKVVRTESPAGTSVQIEWQSVIGRRYRVQYRDDLVSGEWRDLAGDVAASTTASSKVDSTPTSPRFYRVMLLP